MHADEVRELSSLLFGHRYRLELIAAIARNGRDGICVSDLAVGTGVTASVYFPPLQALLKAGLVERRDSLPSSRRVYYVANGSPVWNGLRLMMEDLGVDIDQYQKKPSAQAQAQL